MPNRRVGLWLIGALGGVGATVALGLAAWRRRLCDTTGLVTALPPFAPIDLDPPEAFVVGGHDIRAGSFVQSAAAFAKRSAAFPAALIDACNDDLAAWSENIRPGVLLNDNEAITTLADRADLPLVRSAVAAIALIQDDVRQFRDHHSLDQVVVVNVASTEPPFPADERHETLAGLAGAIRREDRGVLPASGLYAYAALDLGWPYVNFTSSCGATLPALIELAETRGGVVAGQDGKTGETLLKTVLAPMFARRNLRVLSWVGHNILGNRDGRVLSDPQNRASKLKSKDQVVGQALGYLPQTHTSIEYVESLDDWKTAWDHVHFQGFLGVRMTLQFTWTGCDSVLAAPLVIDLARLALLAQRQVETGVLRHLSCFFKNPMGSTEQDFFKQVQSLEDYARRCGNDG